jgi:hypothetical protein
VLDTELRSLSLHDLNTHENTNVQDEEDSDSSDEEGRVTHASLLRIDALCLRFEQGQESFEETEDDCCLQSDQWEEGIMVDVDLSNDLQRVISNIMSKCRSLIKMISKSSNLTSYIDKLKVIHKIRHSLSIDCKSRWNSTKFMMGNLLTFRRLIVQLHSDKHDLSLSSKQKQKLTRLELTSDEWRMVGSIDHVLTPFYNATKLMSGQQYCTIGTALFAIRKMKCFLETTVEPNPSVDGMKNDLLDQLIKYIDDDVDQLDSVLVSKLTFTDQ